MDIAKTTKKGTTRKAAPTRASGQLKHANKETQGYKTVGRGSQTMRIPYDENGHVPEAALLGRFQQWSDQRDQHNLTEDGLMSSRELRRDPRKANRGWKDYTHRSETVLPKKLTPEQAAVWWKNPGSCDIEDIDTPGRSIIFP